jgi:hypothetical protein
MNVAVTWYFASVPRMLDTPSAFAPASNVSATTLAFVGIAVQFWPPRPGGTAAADAAGSGPAVARTPAARNAAAASGPARGVDLLSHRVTFPALAVGVVSKRRAMDARWRVLPPFISITTSEIGKALDDPSKAPPHRR